jgi:hypothetical protein
MRPLLDMDTIQIEITNACLNRCSNCTRFCGHHKRPYMMTLDTFEQAVESMIGYPKMVGIMGGEPLLHPKFEDFCTVISKKIPKTQLGLWTCLPEGFEYLRNIICETFGHIFVNDHTRDDIYHAPILIGVEEIFPDKREMFYKIEHCWVQEAWSAAINPRGAFFCEVAAAMSILFNGPYGWAAEPGWWWKTTKDFREQIEEYCPKCGCALSLPRRASVEVVDDISPKNLQRLEGRSLKIKEGLYKVSDLKLVECPKEMAAYKDIVWRNKVAKRYGIYLLVNEQRFLTPVLLKNFKDKGAKYAAAGG